MDDRSAIAWGLEDRVGKEVDQIKLVNNNGWEFFEDADRAIAPYFTNEILQRINQKKACNILVVGEAGIWKSYCALQVARNIYPRFRIEQVVYRYSAYYDVLMSKRYKIGAPIVMDEPQDAIDHREWFKEAQQALIKTITSQRFMVKPLLVPIINPSLIDKTIRDYLVQFQIECVDRGLARVFRISTSTREPKTFYHHICDLHYGLMDNDLCNKDSCLGCKKLDNCPIFRAQYERKKKVTQFAKYEQEKREALVKESQKLTLNQILEVAYPLREHYVDSNGKINAKKLRLILREAPTNILIGYNKAYDLKTLLEYRYPNVFEGNT